MASVEELFHKIRYCRRCERCRTRNRAVPGEGHAGAGIVLLGEAPGKLEDKTGHPFVGRSGSYLDAALAECGLMRDDLFITSILKCYDPGPPRRHQIEACKPWTVQQVEAVGPKRILVMGLTAARGLLGIRRLSPEPLTVQWQGILCIVTCHPAAAMRFPSRDRQFRRDLRLIARAGPPKR